MREYKIYGEVRENPDTLSFNKFMREVAERINNDRELIERTIKINIEFAKKVKAIFENQENEIYVGSIIAELEFENHRYSYIKHLKFNGKEYEAEIDHLERKFYLIEL